MEAPVMGKKFAKPMITKLLRNKINLLMEIRVSLQQVEFQLNWINYEYNQSITESPGQQSVLNIERIIKVT